VKSYGVKFARALPTTFERHVARWNVSCIGATVGSLCTIRSRRTSIDTAKANSDRERDLDSSRFHWFLENQTLSIKTRRQTAPSHTSYGHGDPAVGL
jgi:hypothetical protein